MQQRAVVRRGSSQRPLMIVVGVLAGAGAAKSGHGDWAAGGILTYVTAYLAVMATAVAVQAGTQRLRDTAVQNFAITGRETVKSSLQVCSHRSALAGDISAPAHAQGSPSAAPCSAPAASAAHAGPKTGRRLRAQVGRTDRQRAVRRRVGAAATVPGIAVWSP